MLQALGADPNLRNNQGKPPEDLAGDLVSHTDPPFLEKT